MTFEERNPDHELRMRMVKTREEFRRRILQNERELAQERMDNAGRQDPRAER